MADNVLNASDDDDDLPPVDERLKLISGPQVKYEGVNPSTGAIRFRRVIPKVAHGHKLSTVIEEAVPEDFDPYFGAFKRVMSGEKP